MRTDTQTSTKSENLNSRLYTENNQQTLRAGSLARLGHLLDVQKAAGSNPARPTNRDYCSGHIWYQHGRRVFSDGSQMF